jgi:uncharacterized phiE125 gp8 family phage protein
MSVARLEVITPPAREPVTLAEAREHCRISWTDEDGRLQDMIVQARQWLEPRVGRALITQTLRATLELSKLRRMPYGVLSGPVAAYKKALTLGLPRAVGTVTVSTVEIEGDIGSLTALTPTTHYVLDTLNEPAQLWLRPAVISFWAPQAVFTTWMGADLPRVRVQYTCGYGDGWGEVPQAYRTAILNAVAYLYEHRDQGGAIPDSLLDGLDIVPSMLVG